ncbi:MAG: nuclear transport factor 2 family protein [Hyphomonadaceae bacterium]|nr:nuclear transport factor 2 family protein [Hyphomonadaceae bacterium]
MPDSPDDIRNLATRFFDAIEKGDVDTVAATYADDVAVWHNTDQLENTKAENVETLKGMVKFSKFRTYTNRRLEVFPGGFVQQHVLEAEGLSGYRLSLPACIICAVSNGKITRLDEYFDSAVVNAWRANRG